MATEGIQQAARAVFYGIGLFYGYGALVHILNIVGLSGFNWGNAPLKWQVLDIVYLVVDVVVCAGFFSRWRMSIAAFIFAAISQVVLYTVLRAWIIDVPAEFAVTPEQENYLTTLVAFHAVTLALFALSYWTVGREYFGFHGPAT